MSIFMPLFALLFASHLNGAFALNEQDSAHLKYILRNQDLKKSWQVQLSHGVIDARRGKDLIFRALWLKWEKPAILWYNGQVLIDRSGNPSLARRIDHLLRQTKTSHHSQGFFPEAHAADSTNTKDVLFLYSLKDHPPATAAAAVADANLLAELKNYVPYRSWLGGLVANKYIECSERGLIAEGDVYLENVNYTPVSLKVKPQSQDRFVIKGLTNDRAYRLTLGSTATEDGRKVLHPQTSEKRAMLAPCKDHDCNAVESSGHIPLEKWNLLVKRAPEEEAKAAADYSPSDRSTRQASNQNLRHQLVSQLFGLSVMGDCCGNDTCRERILSKLKIQLEPAEAAK